MPKFVPRQRKHKVRRREEAARQSDHHGGTDSNVVELVPAMEAEKAARRRELRAELTANQSRVSSKKAKRLEKYIDTKLKKEESSALLKKLAGVNVDTSLFKSSKTLGVNKVSKRDSLSRALLEYKKGINTEENEDKLFTRRQNLSDLSASSSESDSDSAVSAPKDVANGENAESAPASIVGTGLKRPLKRDETGLPVIKKRKQNGNKIGRARKVLRDSEWEGFDSGSSSKSEQSEDEKGNASDRSSLENQTNVDDESDQMSDVDSEESKTAKVRSSGFKAWAVQARNESLDFQSHREPTQDSLATEQKIVFEPRAAEREPLPVELQPFENDQEQTKPSFVHVERSPEIQAARFELPVVKEEQKIMEAIGRNHVVILCGATGSGKTTQIPQFLYEAGYGDPTGASSGLIGVTQPRRVAAVSMAKRVGVELGRHKHVSYQVRFQSSFNEQSRIKFMTDGVLLREISTDISLRKYSAIVIDEAHERSINTDILVGMLSRVVRLRQELHQEDGNIAPLKLIIMSATLRVSDFVSNPLLFTKPPPIISAEGQQYPVSMHFSRRTGLNYLDEAYKKTSRGHRKLPPGGMLVFLTGQQEIMTLMKRLRQKFPNSQGVHDDSSPKVRFSGRDGPLEVEDVELEQKNVHRETPVDDRIDGGLEGDLEDEEDDEDEMNIICDDNISSESNMHILPLYSLLPTQEQLKIFEAPPEGSRLVVLATNVAETSLTIPNIRYIFDCGRVKERKYNQTTGVQSFEVGWISKASAAQRAGRAGRTGPGHCYRLYSSAVYERDFEEYTKPEILRMPIEGVVLQLKSMDVENVVNFPFPTPPKKNTLERAVKLLSHISALGPSGDITELGRNMATFPISPRYSRILLLGNQHGCMPYIVALVAALSTTNIFISETELDLHTPAVEEGNICTNADRLAEDSRTTRRRAYNEAHKESAYRYDSRCDVLKLLSVLISFLSAADRKQFCESYFLRFKALEETALLRTQLTSLLYSNGNYSMPPSSANEPLKAPNQTQLKAMKQILAAGFLDNIAIRADLAPHPPLDLRRAKRAIDVQYLPLFPSQDVTCDKADAVVRIHPSSVLSHVAPDAMPQYLVYTHLQRSTASYVDSAPARIRMHPLTPIGGAQITALAHGTPLLSYGKPIREMMIKAVEGYSLEKRRECWVVPTLQGPPGSTGWPLPARKVVQRKVHGKGWVTV